MNQIILNSLLEGLNILIILSVFEMRCVYYNDSPDIRFSLYIFSLTFEDLSVSKAYQL